MLFRHPALSFGSDWPTQIFPFLSWGSKLDRKTVLSDLTAGITGAVVVLPQGVAFATIAGMPPEYGLYAGMIPAIIAALFGSSWHLVSGPTTAASIIILASVGGFAEPGSAEYVTLVLTLTFMVGILELTMGLMRLGMLVHFISHTVAIGFTAGAAILIAANQAKHFFGLDIPRGAHFYEVVWQIVSQVDKISMSSTAVGLVTVVCGILVKRFLSRRAYLIVAMLVASVFAAVLNYGFGADVVTVGALPASLPPLSSPDFTFETFRDLAPTAFAVTIFALTEAVSISQALAVRSGQQIDGNQELIGQGLSNIAGSFFSGYVATGSFNRSGLNFDAGAKTPLAAVSAGALLMVIVLLVAPYASFLPKAAMAGVLFLVAYGLVDVHHIRIILRSSRAESGVMIATFLSAVFLELDLAIFFGVILSLLLYLHKTSQPAVLSRVPDHGDSRGKFTTDPNLPECPQIKIVRIDGSLFFGAVPYVTQQLRRFEKQAPDQVNLIIVCSGINFIDVAGASFLADEARRRRARGGHMYLIRLKEPVYQRLKRGGYLDTIGPKNVFDSKTIALDVATSRLIPATCKACPRRVFRECEKLSETTPVALPAPETAPSDATATPSMETAS